jgi:hypothetical protein
LTFCCHSYSYSYSTRGEYEYEYEYDSEEKEEEVPASRSEINELHSGREIDVFVADNEI